MPLRTTIPQEIFDIFIDCCYNDPHCLSRFSLVARAWTIGARKHLFRHIVIGNANRAEAFLYLFDSHPVTFAQHIQQLDFMNREHHPNLSLLWIHVLHIILLLNRASAHNIHSMTLSQLIDVNARPEMRTHLIGNIRCLQLHDVKFYYHGFLQFLVHFTGLESLEITAPSIPLVASAPAEELDILSLDVLSQLRSLNLELAFPSPILSWFAKNTARMHRLSECILSLVIGVHTKDFGETLTSFAPFLRSLEVQLFHRSISPDLCNSLNLTFSQNLTSGRIYTRLRENSLCVTSLHFASKLPPSLRTLLFHVFVGIRSENAAEPLCTSAWNSVAKKMTRNRFPNLREFRFVLVIGYANVREQNALNEDRSVIMMSFPESIRDSLEFQVTHW